jgi:hypothetical protein
MTMTVVEYEAPWQARLADQLRRGRLSDVRTEMRGGLHHVVGCYSSASGEEVCHSYAYFSKAHMADQVVRSIRRMAVLN